MRVACLVPYPLGRAPSQRFRLEQWAPYLAASGHRLEFLPLLSERDYDRLYLRGHLVGKGLTLLRRSAARALWTLRDLKEYDVVVVHREALPFGVAWIEKLVAARRPVVFDFDDAIWLPNVSQANAGFAWLKGCGKIDEILSLATAISAGSAYLAQHARALNTEVVVVPTSIDLQAYSEPREHGDRLPLTVGWSGSLTTGTYLRLIEGAIRRAAQSVALRLIIYGAAMDIPGVDVECRPWSVATEVSTLREFDVGLKPVPREEWVLGKCAMKELQYMALGIPVVATRFGSCTEAVGDAGFLCDSEDEWVEALVALGDTGRRQRMGKAGRRVVEDRYSAGRSADLFAGVLRTAVGTPRGTHSPGGRLLP